MERTAVLPLKYIFKALKGSYVWQGGEGGSEHLKHAHEKFSHLRSFVSILMNL